MVTMVVVAGKTFRKRSVSVYMFTLAVVNTGFLIARLLTSSIPYFSGYNITIQHQISCKFLFYLIYIFGTLSSWTLGKLQFVSRKPRTLTLVMNVGKSIQLGKHGCVPSCFASQMKLTKLPLICCFAKQDFK